uniref:Uncharacterized protein n=1 Tax=Zea mays TaxID=4577 RepID=C4J5L1_MAIZE|nr:unknown [Zea mays]
MTSRAGSMATPRRRLVPYLPPPPPPGRSSAPSKQTLAAPSAAPMTPQRRSTSRRRAPRHTDVEMAPGPQLKPTVWRTMFCSLRRLPAHTSVTGSSTASNSVTSCSMVSLAGRLTSPATSTVQVDQSARGTAPWLRT